MRCRFFIAGTFIFFAGTVFGLDLKPDNVGANTRKLSEYINGSIEPAEPGRIPEHLRFHFDEDVLGPAVQYRERQVIIFSVDELKGMFKGRDQKAVTSEINSLKNLINKGGADRAPRIPVFPVTAERQLFMAKPHYLSFSNGAGIRFISQFGKESESAPPANGMFYTFQGFTSDGKHLVCVFYPVSVRTFHAGQDAATTTLILEEMSPEAFTPNLDDLDAFVRSITITPPPPPSKRRSPK